MAQETPNQANIQAPQCPQNCRMCSMQQRSYCSSQMSLYMLGTLQDMVAEIKTMKQDMQEIKNACGNNEASFIDIGKGDMAQMGSGADTIDSQDNQLFTN